MKKLSFLLFAFAIIGCNENQSVTEEPVQESNSIDLKAELNSIEETRSAFQKAIKEKRYADLRQYATADMKGVSPGSEDWLDYKRIREKPMGQFSYDSIRMKPQETVIVSDSVAYDFGTSTVYYTNAEGESIELKDTFLVILKKDKKDGVWKMHREVASAVVE